MFLEERFGRAKFDAFLKNYFNHFAFKSITTEDFMDYFHTHLHADNPNAVTQAELEEWIYKPGLPSTAANPQSGAFDKVMAQSLRWTSGEIKAGDIQTKEWSTHEWLNFLNGLPDGLTHEQFAEIDKAFALTGTQNAETAFAWYMQAIKGGYDPILPELENFLMTVGRGKFIYRLYGALNHRGKKEWAARVYTAARAGYHPIAQRRIDTILAQ